MILTKHKWSECVKCLVTNFIKQGIVIFQTLSTYVMWSKSNNRILHSSSLSLTEEFKRFETAV